MAVDTQRGQVKREAVVYFENSRGHVIVAPNRDHPTPWGYRREEADTVAKIERLSRKMSDQEHQRVEELNERDWLLYERAIKENRSKLFARLMATDCSAKEAGFVRAAIKRLDDNLHRRYTVNTVHGRFDMETREGAQ